MFCSWPERCYQALSKVSPSSNSLSCLLDCQRLGASCFN
uniref:Uncharacterized protein n=1 Tax=Arundo donax TaxID=35708 RepID=A0A0A9GKQ5_ARUDO